MKCDRKFSADEALQIIDRLVKSGAVARVDVCGMTELALLLKQIEYNDRAEIETDLDQCYRTIHIFTQEVSSVLP